MDQSAISSMYVWKRRSVVL